MKRTPSTPAAENTGLPPVVQRPDGWYWLAEEGHRETGPFEVGPFASADDALADWRGPSPIEPGQTLAQAEAELNMTDWIDPQTGAPAEDHALHTGDE